ncbi:uncharacterized protein LOC111094946 isoform X1 [Canis lupus familiaris]|uniref:uncharacterized protein LOC111094946 isoform X1 n=1 Tax=Canis lupus familiaris TaxID=9615 RepID=UPI0018F7DFA6|nr:uncharacterized protein LOC111094946 isoform X1 [Canis lupus familiaris]
MAATEAGSPTPDAAVGPDDGFMGPNHSRTVRISLGDSRGHLHTRVGLELTALRSSAPASARASRAARLPRARDRGHSPAARGHARPVGPTWRLGSQTVRPAGAADTGRALQDTEQPPCRVRRLGALWAGRREPLKVTPRYTTLDPATRVHTSSQRPAALTHISLRAGPTRTTPGPCEVTSDQSFGPTCAPCPSLRAVTTRARALASTGFSSGAADVLSNGFRRACVRPATRTWPGGAWGHGQRWGVRSGHMQGLWGPSSARGEGRPPDPAAQRGPNPQLSRQGSRAAFRGRGREQPDGGTTAQRGSHGAKTSVIRK